MVANVGFFSLYGLIIKVQWEGEGAEDEARFFFSSFPFNQTFKTCLPFHISLNFITSEVPPEISVSESRSCHDVTIYENNGCLSLTDGVSYFQVWPQEGRGLITLHPSVKQRSISSKSSLFLMGLIYLLSVHGFYDLHAAGISGENIGFLLLGDSGSAKSSITLSLVHQGWQYVSDDALLIKSSPDGVKAFAFRKKFHLDPVLTRHYPEITPHLEVTPVKGNIKRFLNVESVYPDQFCSSCFPRILVFTRISYQSESILVPVDKTSALVRLMKQSASIFFNRQEARRHIEVLKRLVYQADSFDLFAGRDLYDTPEKVLEIFSKAMVKVL